MVSNVDELIGGDRCREAASFIFRLLHNGISHYQVNKKHEPPPNGRIYFLDLFSINEEINLV